MNMIRLSRIASMSGMLLFACRPGASEVAFARSCSRGYVSVNGTSCTVTPGTAITVSAAASPGLDAQNSGGKIVANGITVNLCAGALARTFIGARTLT